MMASTVVTDVRYQLTHVLIEITDTVNILVTHLNMKTLLLLLFTSIHEPSMLNTQKTNTTLRLQLGFLDL